ncbi:Uncharacterised protein [Segatella copri]|nr:Uncharacterised protein [Segatella copri]
MEVSVRTTHHYLVAWLQREDVRRSDTCWYVLESYLWTWQEWSCGDTYGQGDDVTLVRIVRHRVSTNGRLWIVSLEREDVELLPCSDVLLANEILVEILVVIDAVVCRNLDLSVRTRNEVHVLAWRQSHLELLDE